MGTNETDKESWFLLGLIAFGLIATMAIELSDLHYTPVVLLIFIGISTTALIYKLLGGLDSSSFGTPIFRITGSGAYLFAFIYFINPILERQIIPEKGKLFTPATESWIAVDKVSLSPIDTLDLKFMDFSFASNEFGQNTNDRPLYFKPAINAFEFYNNESCDLKLGKIDAESIIESICIMETIESPKSEFFTQKLSLNESTPHRAWLPFFIKPVQFDNNITSYEIYEKDKVTNKRKLLSTDDIVLRGSNIHVIDEKIYLISIHETDHTTTPPYVRFGVTELEASLHKSIN